MRRRRRRRGRRGRASGAWRARSPRDRPPDAAAAAAAAEEEDDDAADHRPDHHHPPPPPPDHHPPPIRRREGDGEEEGRDGRDHGEGEEDDDEEEGAAAAAHPPGLVGQPPESILRHKHRGGPSFLPPPRERIVPVSGGVRRLPVRSAVLDARVSVHDAARDVVPDVGRTDAGGHVGPPVGVALVERGADVPPHDGQPDD